MTHLDNIQFWESKGARIQYKGGPNYPWKFIRHKIKQFNEKWIYRVYPDDLKGFHLDIRMWADAHNTYVTTGIYWKGQNLGATLAETGGESYGKQVGEQWLRDRGVVFTYLRDVQGSYSSVAIKKKSDL